RSQVVVLRDLQLLIRFLSRAKAGRDLSLRCFRMSSSLTALFIFLAVTFTPLIGSQSGSLTATTRNAPPPSELAPAILAVLSNDAVAVTASQAAATLEFWWVKSLPM